jgi:hypothetical protein
MFMILKGDSICTTHVFEKPPRRSLPLAWAFVWIHLGAILSTAISFSASMLDGHRWLGCRCPGAYSGLFQWLRIQFPLLETLRKALIRTENGVRGTCAPNIPSTRDELFMQELQQQSPPTLAERKRKGKVGG